MDGFAILFILWIGFELLGFLLVYSSRHHIRLRIHTTQELDEYKNYIEEYHKEKWQEFLAKNQRSDHGNSHLSNKLLSDFIIKNHIEREHAQKYNKTTVDDKILLFVGVTAMSGTLAFMIWTIL